MIEQLMMDVHDLSVSGNKHGESVGRLMKGMIPVTLDWLEAERQGGTDNADALYAMVKAHIGLAHVVTSIIGRSDAASLRMLGDAYGKAFSSFADSLSEADRKGRKKQGAK